MPAKILLVDDEEGVVNALERLFRKEQYTVLKAKCAADARVAIKTHQDIAVIICDMRMPDENGDQVLLHAHEVLPNAHRIALSGYADTELILSSINKGHVERFFLKPWDDEILRETVKKCVWQYGAALENRRLESLVYEKNEELQQVNASLEDAVAKRTEALHRAAKRIHESIFSILEMLTRLMEVQVPGLRGHCRRVADLSALLAKEAGCSEDDASIIEMAALVHDIGKGALPPNIHRKRILDMTDKEKTAYCQHPIIGAELLAEVPWFEKIVSLVRHHHESVSGKGYPAHLKGDAIPLGARIIAIADTYDRHRFPIGENVMGSRAQTEQFLRMSCGGRLDPKLVDLFLKADIPTHNEGGDISVEVPIEKVRPGMVLARDVLNSLNHPLLRCPCTLTQAEIDGLSHNPSFDPIMSRIFIVRDSIPESGLSEEEVQAIEALHNAADIPDMALLADAGGAASGEAKLIMAVDDEPSILSALKRELHFSGYHLATFVNPIDALRELRSGKKYMALLTDYSMPAVRGDRFLVQVQREFPNLPCIVITAKATRDTILNLGRAAKIVRIFPKPWKKEELLATLNQLEWPSPEE